VILLQVACSLVDHGRQDHWDLLLEVHDLWYDDPHHPVVLLAILLAIHDLVVHCHLDCWDLFQGDHSVHFGPPHHCIVRLMNQAVL
jgi:hypothetical protein